MHTFYVPITLPDAETVEITGGEHHHLRNVLRLKQKDEVRIIDGKGHVFITKLSSIGNELTTTSVIKQDYFEKKLPTLTLFQGVPKSDKMELILQKSTELGVSQIVPMSTERSLQQPSVKRFERWERVVVSATKQCKRVWMPKLNNVREYNDCLNKLDGERLNLILCEKEEEQHIKMVFKDAPQVRSVSFFIGPEGGFTDKELNAAVNKGCIPTTICLNTLRTETAAIAAIAIAAYEYQL